MGLEKVKRMTGRSLRLWAILAISTLGLLAQVNASDEDLGFMKSRRIFPRILEEGRSGGRAQRYKRDTGISSTKRLDGMGHLDRVTLELPLDSSLHVLDLKLNRELISKGYFVRTQSENLEPVISNPNHLETDLCHYHGRIRGLPNSWAALSTCNGLRGIVFDGKETHYLEPSTSLQSQGSRGKDKEVRWETIHFKDAHRLKNLTCGHAHTPIPSLPQKLSRISRVKREAVTSGFEVPYNSGIKSRYVEMVIVVDKRKYEQLGSDLAKVTLRTKDIANIVNALYVPLNIFVALVGVVVWTNQDAINISTKGDDTLSSFLLYRRERLLKDHPNDNAQLLTAIEFEEGVVGKAMQGPICSYKYSGGVNSDHKSVVGIVATTVAHELGHNFGLSHDDGDTKNCKCDGPESKCIMSASSSSNRTAHWSSCSKEEMNYAMEHGMDYCLRNKPRSLFDPSTCGNGFVEVGEECDCGHPEHCKNYCCNAHTCKLHSNATCGGGTCCDTNTCQLRVGGTVCRPEQTQCDLPEYCNGESEFCPEDIHKLDGLECETKSGKAYCAGGECRTHTDQCQVLWGPTGRNSKDICYQKNVNGSRYGHCGYDLMTQKFTPCAPADMKCGILQCEHHHEKLEFGYESVAILSSFFLNVGGDIHTCRSVATDFGLDVADPGLAPNGAVCGPNKMCFNQKCVSKDSIPVPPICRNNCSGNGICNSKGRCHCNYGHGGDECDSGGYGGSIDSGPTVNPHGGASLFARALIVTFLGFIPLVAVISFYLYHAGDNFKKLFRRGQVVSSPSQSRDKPNQNGRNSGGRSGKHISNPSASASSGGDAETGNKPNGVIGSDLFGQYKGFSLSPIRNAPPSTTANFMNNNFKDSASNQNIQNEELPPLPPLPTKETQAFVKHETNFLQKTIGRGVSWKEPVASSAPISPDQEDASSNNSDTPLTNAQKNSPKIRPLSSPDALNDAKLFDPPAQPKKYSPFGSTSALSRLAAALPFVRTFSHESSENHTSPRTSSSSLQRQRSFNRDTLEISKPILQNLTQVHGNLIPVKNQDIDVVDAPKTEHRYENVPVPDKNVSHHVNIPQDDPKKSPRINVKSKPSPKTVDRIKNETPAFTPPLNPGSNGGKVQRAQSMIQANRKSVVGNPNYNSLRKSRPTAPPPKPPEVTQVSAIQPPPPLITTLPNKPSSILKFSNNNPQLISKAPIAKLDDSDIGSPMSNGSSPSPKNGNSKAENIYDVIDEGGVEKVETLSTGSSDGGGSGLLSDIISEIESRNKESIYNSVDRRKKKREKLKAASPKIIQQKCEPEQANNTHITVNPNFQQNSPQSVKKSLKPTPKINGSSPPSVSKYPGPGRAKPIPPPAETSNVAAAPIPSSSIPKEMSPNISAKPTCAVNGIPKVTTVTNGSPSYVAKINYFTNLGAPKAEPLQMKPISSLSQALITAAADKEKEPAYAPGQLSTIRPTWSRKSSIGKGEGGIYSKPVATPQIPQSVSKDSTPSSRSGSSSPVPSVEKPSGSDSAANGEEKTKGYKSFNPYLNRPLTFSTFRPSSSNSNPKLGLLGGPEPLHNGMCSLGKPSLSNSLLNSSNVVSGVGLTSPVVQLRSPSRMVRS